MNRNHATSLLAFNIAILAASGAYASPQSVNEQQRTLAATPVKQVASDNKYALGTYYTHADRKGGGRKSENDTVTLRLSEKLTPTRTQFITLTGDDGDFLNNTVSDRNDTLAASYGQIWGSSEHRGLVYYASVFGSKGWSDSSAAPAGMHYSTGVGVVGGATQVVPLSSLDRMFVGSSLSLSYLQISGSHDEKEGPGVLAGPYVQYNRDITADLSGYVQAAGTLSSRGASIAGEGSIFTPSAGLDYKLYDYTIGGQYTYEYGSKHSGNRMGFSVSRSF